MTQDEKENIALSESSKIFDVLQDTLKKELEKRKIEYSVFSEFKQPWGEMEDVLFLIMAKHLNIEKTCIKER